MVPLEHWHQGEAFIHQVNRELRKRGEVGMADAYYQPPKTSFQATQLLGGAQHPEEGTPISPQVPLNLT